MILKGSSDVILNACLWLCLNVLVFEVQTGWKLGWEGKTEWNGVVTWGKMTD